MFKETDDGQTQYCPMCLEWAEKYEKLKEENEELFKECENDKKRVYSMKVLSDKYKQALEEVREIVDKACKKCKNDEFGEDYCIGSEFCALAEINEVLKDE